MKTTVRIAEMILFFCLTMYSCQEELKDPIQSLPQISTTNASFTESTTAILGGIVTCDGGQPILSRGVCWNTTGSPTLLDSKTTDGTGTGIFVCNLTGLNPGTKYYARTYATNKAGTSYGNEVTFTTSHGMQVTVSSIELISSTKTSALLRSIIPVNGAPVFERGVCWNITGDPTISDNRTNDGSGAGTFESNLTGLTQSTNYYIRAYATNSSGVFYGDALMIRTIPQQTSPGEIAFNPDLHYGLLYDIEWNSYKTIKIGTQTWMAENLKTTKFNDGTDIPLVEENASWVQLTTPAYCWYNNDPSTYKSAYGALYNWFTVNTGKLCPDGWHVPTDSDWTTLTISLGSISTTAGKLKEMGVSHWQSPNAGSTNESGFTAVPAGSRYGGQYGYSGFNSIYEACFMWSSTLHFTTEPFFDLDGVNYYNLIKLREIFIYSKQLDYDFGDQRTGASVRCLKTDIEQNND